MFAPNTSLSLMYVCVCKFVSCYKLNKMPCCNEIVAYKFFRLVSQLLIILFSSYERYILHITRYTWRWGGRIYFEVSLYFIIFFVILFHSLSLISRLFCFLLHSLSSTISFAKLNRVWNQILANWKLSWLKEYNHHFK